MKHIPEVELYTNMARIIRAYRKYMGLGQRDIARKIGMTQSSISKVENQKKKISGAEWVSFCIWAKVDLQCFRGGYLEFGRTLSLSDDRKVGEFTLPGRYSYLKGSSTRSLQPFIEIARSHFGCDWIDGWFTANGVDPDYMYILDNPINRNLLSDFVETLFTQKGVSERSLFVELANSQIFKIGQSALHGLTTFGKQNYDHVDPIIFNRTLLNAKSRYEINTDINWLVDSTDKLKFEWVQKAHNNEYKTSGQVKHFMSGYESNFLKYVQGISGPQRCHVNVGVGLDKKVVEISKIQPSIYL